MLRFVLLTALVFSTGCAASTASVASECPAAAGAPPARCVHTFSIVAIDSKNGDLGVAVASKFLAVGVCTAFAQAKVGAVVTQAWANTTYGPRGLTLLENGASAEDALTVLTKADEGREHRQLAIVDAKGRVAGFTGGKCYGFAGHRTGKTYSVQGNLLVGKAVIDAMAEAFEKAEGELAERMMAALAAAEAAGGDKRGKQSAALLVVRDKGGYSGFNDRYIDLRVDDHAKPVEELARLLKLHRREWANE
jgi:uncharacterized Ntn-hydrolase superfamily protein